MSKKSALLPGERCDSEWCEVRRSGIHGRGLFARKKIPAGTYVIEYVGERIDKDEANERGWAQMEHAQETGDAAVYIFTLNDEWDIDGNVPENSARLINHSCDPNCEAFIEEDAIWIAALRTIKRDEELFFNYGFDLENYKEHPCRCGTKKCVGYIAGEDYWKELKKRLKKSEKKSKKKKRSKK
ncbi:MAG: SET domain-containing protein-lysine N-methyltransferase [Verrucomicrobiales bacterium]|jgi:SET domain-containing protein|nr:SET domain-containing protein-lysine N-methyltransferase [Verrucomicrobiales bacterium]